MAFGDVFAGWEGEAAKHYQNVLSMDYTNKRELAQRYAQLADDPRYDEASKNEFMRRALEIPTLEPGKKLPKEYADFSIKVQPPTGPPVNQGGAPSPAPLPGGGMGPQLPQSPLVQQQMEAQNQPPVPPQHPVGEMLPWNEQMQRATAQSVAKSAGAYGIAGLKASIPHINGSYDAQIGPERFKIYQKQRYNPQTGQMEQWEEQSEFPRAAFAPRLGSVISVATLKKWHEFDPESPILDEGTAPLDLSKLPDDMLIQPIGGDRYRPYEQGKTLKDVAGNEYPVGKFTGTIAGPSQGQTTSALATTRQQVVQTPLGGIGIVDLTTQKKVPPPVAPPGQAAQPTPQTPPAQQPPATPQGQNVQTVPPELEADVRNKVLSTGMLNWLASWNKGTTPETIRQQMVKDGWQDATQQGSAPATAQPTPAAPEPPPQSAPDGGVKPVKVTPIEGGGRRLGAKEASDMQTRAGVLGTTIGRGAGALSFYDKLLQNPDQLHTFLKRAQMQVVTNSHSPTGVSIAVSNMSQLTPEEAKFAGDYISLGEDINVMRSITNATGFRSAEAFAVLLGQRGDLLGNPKVFKQTLQNSLRTIITQLGPMNKTLHLSGVTMPITQDIFNGYQAVYGPDRKAVADALRSDQWIK